jgi:hypothetical protein
MFTADLNSFKIQEKELHQQAAQQRMIKRIEKANPLATRIAANAGRMLIQTGEQLISRTQIQD